MQKRSPRSGLRPLRRIQVLLTGIVLLIYWWRLPPPRFAPGPPAGGI